MSPSRPPQSSRRSNPPSIPEELRAALEAVRADVDDLENWDAAEEIASELERPEELLALYEEVLLSKRAPELLVELGRRAADHCEEWFEDSENAVRVLSRVLEVDHSQTWAFERLTVLLTSSSSWEQLLEVYDRAIQGAETEEERVHLLGEAARVARDFAGQAHRGTDYLKALLLLRPRDDQLASTLERRLEELNRDLDLIEVWSARVQVLDRETALRTRLAIAARHLAPLQDPKSALEVLVELLELGGDRAEAALVLERIAGESGFAVEQRQQALGLLDDIYSGLQRSSELVSVTERELALADKAEARIRLRRKAARLLEALSREPEALAHTVEILVLDPSLDDVKEQARRLATSTGQLDVYAEALIRAAGASASPSRRVELWSEAGDLKKNVVRDVEGAVALFEQVLREDAVARASELLASRELSELFGELGKMDRLLPILERRAELEPEEAERKRVLGFAARLAEEQGEPDRALGLWAKRLADDEADIEALGSRIVLLERLRRYPGMVENLEDRARIAEDPRVQRTDLVRVAEVYREHLQDLPQAIRTWRDIEQKFGRTDESLNALIDLSEQAARFEDVVTLLREKIKGESDSAEQAESWAHLGDTFRLHLQKYEDAIEEYRAALTVEPEHAAAREGLRSLLVSKEHAHAAVEALASALRHSSETQGLLELLEVRIAASPSEELSSAILLEAARLQEDAGELGEALRATCRAFALGLDPRVEEDAHRLASASSDFVTLVTAYQKAIERAEGERARALHFRQGQVWETQLGRPAGAASAYEAALQLKPEDPEVARALLRAAFRARLFSEAADASIEHARAVELLPQVVVAGFEEHLDSVESWEEALDALAASIAGAEGLPAQLTHDLKRQLAVWHRDRRGDADAAELVLRRAVQDHPREDSLRMLAELQRRAPGLPLVRTLESLADVTGEELSVLREAASVALDAVGDRALSERLLGRTRDVVVRQFEALESGKSEADSAPEELVELAEWSIENWVALALGAKETEHAVDLLESAARFPLSSQKKESFLFRAAELAAQLPSDARAIVLSNQVLEENPIHDAAIGLLSELHEKSGRIEELLALRTRELALDRSIERQLFLRLDQARVLGQLGEAPELRVKALRENLAAAPGHVESIEALEALLLELERFEETVELLEGEAQILALREPARAAQLFQRAGELAESQLSDVARLESDFKSAAAIHSTPLVLDRLAVLAEARAEHEAEIGWLVQLLAQTLEASHSSAAAESRRATVVRLARAHIVTGEVSAARALLENELAADPAGEQVRGLLAELYTEAEDYPKLARLLIDGVEFARDDEARVVLLRSSAQVVRRRLDDVAGAIPLLQRATALAPLDRVLRLQLADALRVQGHHEPARTILTAMLEEFGRRRTKERALVHQQLARIAQARGELDEALEQAEAAAKIERTDAGILMLVGRLARQKGELEQAEQAYRTLLLIVSRGSFSPVEAEQEAIGESSILFELSKIAEEDGQEERAQELLRSALEVAARDPEEALRLEPELSASGRVELLLHALAERLRTGVSGDEAARIGVARAQVLARQDRFEEAFDARLDALEQTPTDARLLDATWKLAEQLGQTERLERHMERLADSSVAAPEIAGDIWFRLAVISEERDPELAIARYERAQQTEHRPWRTFQALDRLLSGLGDGERIVSALRRFVRISGADAHPSALAEAHYRLAAHELSRADYASASEQLERASAIEKKEARILDLLSSFIEVADLPAALVRLFLDVARKVGEPRSRLLGLLRASAQEDVTSELLEEGLELARSLGDDDARSLLLDRAIEIEAARERLAGARDLLVERARLALARQELPRAAQLFREAAPYFEGEEAIDLELSYAELAHGPLRDPASAARAYEHLLERAPGDRRVWQPLLSLYRSQGRTEDIEACIVRIEPAIQDSADLDLLRLERARILIAEGRFEDAEASLRNALQERPELTEAASLLADLLREQARHEELREHWERLFDLSREQGDAQRIAVYGLELAGIVESVDRREAIDILVSGLNWTRDRREVLEKLLSLYQQEGDREDYAEILEALVALESGEDARSLALELADVRGVLGDRFGVGRALELGFRAAPHDEQITTRFVEYLKAEEEYSRLAETWVFWAERTEAPLQASLRYAAAAQIYEENLGDAELSARYFARAFEKQPERVEFMERAAAHWFSLGELAEALARVSAAIETTDEIALADLLELRASLIARDLSDDPRLVSSAASDLKRALGLFVSEEQAETLLQSREELLSRLVGLYASTHETEAERTTLLELAEVQLELQRAEEAVGTLVGWLREHEDDRLVAEELKRLAELAGDHETALFAAHRLYETSSEGERVGAVLSFAEIAEKAGSPREAREALIEVSRAFPQVEILRQRLRRTYEAEGAYRELAEMLAQEAETTEESSQRISLFTEAGELLLQAQDPQAAAVYLERARELSTEPWLMTPQLSECYMELGDLERAKLVLDEAVEAHGKRRSPELSSLQWGLARVARMSGDVEGMYSWLEAALMSDRNNSEVAVELALRGQEDGRFDVAIKALQMITLSKTPCSMSKAEAYYRQAEIAELQGDPKKALLLARRALTTEEGFPAAQALVERLA